MPDILEIKSFIYQNYPDFFLRLNLYYKIA